LFDQGAGHRVYLESLPKYFVPRRIPRR